MNQSVSFHIVLQITQHYLALISGPAIDSNIGKTRNDLKRASEHLQLISGHDPLVLLCASCSAPKLIHVMRSSPCASHTLLSDIDNSLHLTLCNITNINIIDEQWRQTGLPFKAGGK